MNFKLLVFGALVATAAHANIIVTQPIRICLNPLEYYGAAQQAPTLTQPTMSFQSSIQQPIPMSRPIATQPKQPAQFITQQQHPQIVSQQQQPKIIYQQQPQMMPQQQHQMAFQQPQMIYQQYPQILSQEMSQQSQMMSQQQKSQQMPQRIQPVSMKLPSQVMQQIGGNGMSQHQRIDGVTQQFGGMMQTSNNNGNFIQQFEFGNLPKIGMRSQSRFQGSQYGAANFGRDILTSGFNRGFSASGFNGGFSGFGGRDC